MLDGDNSVLLQSSWKVIWEFVFDRYETDQTDQISGCHVAQFLSGTMDYSEDTLNLCPIVKLGENRELPPFTLNTALKSCYFSVISKAQDSATSPKACRHLYNFMHKCKCKSHIKIAQISAELFLKSRQLRQCHRKTFRCDFRCNL